MTDMNVKLILSLKNQLRGGVAGVRRDLAGLKKDVSSISGAFGTAKGIAGALGGIYAAKKALGATVGEAVSFDKAMASVRKKVEAPSPEAFERLEATIRRTSIALGLPREQVAELTAEAGAAGIAFNDLERFINLSAKAAVGWDMAPAEASQKLAEIKASTNMTIGQLETLADKINALGDNSASKERNIVDMFLRAGAAAKEAGVDFDTSLAALTAVNSTGMQPEVVARWFGAFTGGLRTIEHKPKRVAQGLKILGLDAKKVATGMKRDALGTMLDIFERLEKSPEAATAAIKIFGQEWWDETSRAKAAIPEIRKQLDLLRNPGNYKGSLQKTLQVELNTTANHLERLKSLSSDIGDRLGRWALPPINDAIDGLIKRVDDLDQRAGFRERQQAENEARNAPEWKRRLQERQAEEQRQREERLNGGGRGIVGATSDAILGREVTKDQAREISNLLNQRANDAEALASAKAKEAAELLGKAGNAKGGDRAALTKAAQEAAAAVASAKADASLDRRGAGVAAARDMTGLEAGEDKAVAIIRGMRTVDKDLTLEINKLKTKIGNAQKELDKPFVTDRARKQGIVDEWKQQLQELEGVANKPAAEIKQKLSMDLSPEGHQIVATLAAGMGTGAPAAIVAAREIGSNIRSAMIAGPTAPATIGNRESGGASNGGNGGKPLAMTVNLGGIHVTRATNPDEVADLAGKKLATAIRSSMSRALHDGTVG